MVVAEVRATDSSCFRGKLRHGEGIGIGPVATWYVVLKLRNGITMVHAIRCVLSGAPRDALAPEMRCARLEVETANAMKIPCSQIPQMFMMNLNALFFLAMLI
jgi:hypothetical protein